MATGTEYDHVVTRMVEMTEALIRNPDFYRVQAEATRKRFEALMDAGFDEAQAVALTAAQGPGFETKGSY